MSARHINVFKKAKTASPGNTPAALKGGRAIPLHVAQTAKDKRIIKIGHAIGYLVLIWGASFYPIMWLLGWPENTQANTVFGISFAFLHLLFFTAESMNPVDGKCAKWGLILFWCLPLGGGLLYVIFKIVTTIIGL